MSFPPSVCLILNFLTTLLVHRHQFSMAGSNETDQLALYEIKARVTHDPLGIMTSWNKTLHFCEWHGVTCGHRHQRVTVLDLTSSKLTGTLSPFVGNLSFLRELHLYNNSFTGVIPAEIDRLHRLQSLELCNNSFEGEIPSNLSCCSDLISLRLSRNNLVGEIPPELGSLLDLQYLILTGNNLTGAIPSSLGNLTSLSRLFMNTNSLIGTIPHSLGRLKKLTSFVLSENKLSGIVPPSIFNLSLLTSLDVGENHFLEGSLPLNLGRMVPNLQFFSIGYNHFTGPIPASISNCSDLGTLELNYNNLQGEVPCLHKLHRLERFALHSNSLGFGQPTDLDFVSCLANATFLNLLELGENNFGGIFPSVICNFTTLSMLDLGTNKIAGQIPACIQNLVGLQLFDLLGNKLSGVIPSSVGKLQNLIYLDISANQLLGHIPSSIGNLTRLTKIFLSENNLEGHIPSTLGNCRYLLVLDLFSNNLSGRIPLQVFSLYSSYYLDMSYNPLTGSLPKEVEKLKNLVLLSIANTMLSSEIPGTLGACIALEFLLLQGNHFHGAIPSTFISLRGLQELDLSLNNLSGEIPKFLAALPLGTLNLSYNNFEGEVPIGGVFSNETGLSVVGNSGLCGGIHELKLPPCRFRQSRKGRLHHRRRLMIAIFSGVLGFVLLVALIAICAFCLKRRRKEPGGESEMLLPSLSYQDILKATNEFSSENLIGSGTFGVVYKAIIDQGRTVVAVKIFNLAHRGASKSFVAECKVLRNIRHRNLIKVITSCSSVDYKGNDFKALVYVYMVNGSLEDWLHQKLIPGAEGTSDAPRKLNLLQRFDIAIDVALALEYLHHHCDAPIVHCDLKPSNVLLDDEMVAHVGDFGLAKILSICVANSQTNPSCSIGVRGTIGYTPPEYGLGNKLSTRGDVYSFGILLLEIFTGKRPADDMFKEGMSLQSFVQAAWPERVMEILDHVLLEDIIGEETNTSADRTHHVLRTGKSKVILEALTAVLGIALSCSAELPQERLEMSEVAAKLSSIKNKLRGIRSLQQRQIPAGI